MGLIGKTIKDIFSPPDYKKLEKINKKYAKMDEEEANKIKGLGGWLISVQIGFILSALILSYYTLIFFLLFAEGDILMLLMFLLYGSFAFFLIYSLILLYKKKKEFPRWAIFTLWYSFGLVIMISFMFLERLEEIITGILADLIPSIIWTLYFKKSKRVKNTFVK